MLDACASAARASRCRGICCFHTCAAPLAAFCCRLPPQVPMIWRCRTPEFMNSISWR